MPETRMVSGPKEDQFARALTLALEVYLGGRVLEAERVKLRIVNGMAFEVEFTCEIPLFDGRRTVLGPDQTPDVVGPPKLRRITLVER